MDAAYRRIAVPVVVALALLAPSCTRERPTPPPTATLSFSGEAPTPIPVAETPPAPEQESTPETAEADAADELEADATPTPAAPEQTFQYPVQPGDTVLSIAIKFETDVDTIRELNALESDIIAVGQPLYVPYVEGMTIEGMPPPTPGPFAYTVQTGDTLNAIALRYGVDPIDIIEYNNLLSPDSLTVGVDIIIPNYQPPAALSDAGDGESSIVSPALDDGQFIHVVQSGQGLFEIADLYGVSPNDIALTNNMNDTNLLRVGQELIIPGVSVRDAAISKGSLHVVQTGESLLGIAIRYGVTVEEILEINELADADSIFEGQELIIPGQ